MVKSGTEMIQHISSCNKDQISCWDGRMSAYSKHAIVFRIGLLYADIVLEFTKHYVQ